MKPRSVKTKTIQMVKVFGGRKEFAKKLQIALSYVYRLEKGHVPGKRLYRDICKLHQESSK